MRRKIPYLAWREGPEGPQVVVDLLKVIDVVDLSRSREFVPLLPGINLSPVLVTLLIYMLPTSLKPGGGCLPCVSRYLLTVSLKFLLL